MKSNIIRHQNPMQSGRLSVEYIANLSFFSKKEKAKLPGKYSRYFCKLLRLERRGSTQDLEICLI